MRKKALSFCVSGVDLFWLIHWAFDLCVFKYSNAGLFRAQRSGENYHNGLILEWDGNLLLQDCVIVNLCFLLLSLGWLSDVLDAIFTSADKKDGFGL